jgi:hypothetical protein
MLITRYRVPSAVLLAMAGFIVSWVVIHHGWFTHKLMLDTTVYAHYSAFMKRGLVPYLNFKFEYPPLAALIFLIPGWIAGSSWHVFEQSFELMMLVMGLVTVGVAAWLLARERVTPARLAAGVALGALTPLLIGPVILSRFDLFPTMLTILALAALLTRRPRIAFVLLGLGVAAKAYPFVMVPLALVYVWRNSSRREALIGVGMFVAVVALFYVPFLAIAPHGVVWSLRDQGTRPLQIESAAASLWLAAHQIVGLHLKIFFSHGSDNLYGHPPTTAASVMTIVQWLVIAVVWVTFALGKATKERLVLTSAAAVCAFLFLGRVLSPQYLIWLVPLVMMAPGRRGFAAVGLLAVSMVLTQVWFPQHFLQLKEFQPLQSWAVIARNTVLLVLLGTLAWPDVPLLRIARNWVSRLRHAPPSVSGLAHPEEA